MSEFGRNYYEILNSQPTANLDELRRNYKQLILQCHPDKLQQNVTKSAHDASTSGGKDISETYINPNSVESEKSFLAINEAWNTLKDTESRKLYDAELVLTKFQAHNNVYEKLNLNDMKKKFVNIETFDQDDRQEESNKKTKVLIDCYTYDCRCGGQYIIDDESVLQTDNNDGDDGDEIIIECNECSLVIILNRESYFREKPQETK